MVAARHTCDRQRRSGESERWIALQIEEQAEQAYEANKGLRQERGYAETSAGVALEERLNQSLKSISATG